MHVCMYVCMYVYIYIYIHTRNINKSGRSQMTPEGLRSSHWAAPICFAVYLRPTCTQPQALASSMNHHLRFSEFVYLSYIFAGFS